MNAGKTEGTDGLVSTPGWLRVAVRAVLIAALAMTTLFSLSPSLGPDTVGLWDKLAHVLAYAVLAIFSLLGFSGRHRLVAVLLLTIYAGSMEVAQIHVPGRTGSVADFVANLIGISAGSAAVVLLSHSIRRAGPRRRRLPPWLQP